jgi:hypothetical protein
MNPDENRINVLDIKNFTSDIFLSRDRLSHSNKT